MEKNKLYACSTCGQLVKIRSKGLCSYCRFKSKGSQVKTYVIKQQTEKNKEKKRNKTQLMKSYWAYHLNQLEKGKRCENCDVNLQVSIVSICHILPKQRHVDVMDDILNVMYLCDFCHNKFDRIQATSQVYLMKVFPIALQRYKEFKNKITIYSKYVEIFEDWLKENNK